MAKLVFHAALFMAVLLILHGSISWRVEGGRQKLLNRKTECSTKSSTEIDCSDNVFCDVFGTKIDFRCQNSSECQTRCNQLDGVFTCSSSPDENCKSSPYKYCKSSPYKYCKCLMN